MTYASVMHCTNTISSKQVGGPWLKWFCKRHPNLKMKKTTGLGESTCKNTESVCRQWVLWYAHWCDEGIWYSAWESLQYGWKGSLGLVWESLQLLILQRATIDQLGGKFLYTDFQKQIHMLTKWQASLFLQICYAHFSLNVYLHRIGKLDTDRCQYCTDNQDVHSFRETIDHFIFECTTYNEAREHLIDKIGRNNSDSSNIMLNSDRMKALATYIYRTGRLSN